MTALLPIRGLFSGRFLRLRSLAPEIAPNLRGAWLLPLFALAACGPQAVAPTPDVPVAQVPSATPTTFRLALSSVPRTLDPGLATDTQSAQVILNTFEGLMAFDRESGPIRYGVAQKYDVSEDGKTYTFKLRESARWSNGDPVTAQDFAYAWRRVLTPSTASEYAWLLTDIARIAGAADFNTGRDSGEHLGIEAPDPHTLIVRLEEPVPYFLDLMAFATFMPVPQKAELEGVAWNEPTHWISNGPYVLTDESSGRSYVLARNPQYWDEASVAMDRIELKVFENDEQRVGAFDAGDLDWTGPQELPLSQIQTLASRREFRQDTYLAVEYLVFNTKVAPLNDARVRQAVALAIDRDAVVRQPLAGVGQVAYGFVPPIPGYSTQVQREHDLDRARALLAEAGFPEGQGLPTLTYLYPSGNRNAEAVGHLLKEQLAASLGIELALADRPLVDLLDTLRAGDFQLARSAWVGDIADPVSFLGLWVSESQHNKAGWKNADYDKLMNEAAATRDRGGRYATLARAELLIAHDAPVIPLYYKQQTYLLAPGIEGFATHKLNVHLLKYVTKAAP